MASEIKINLKPNEAHNFINHAIVTGSVTGELIDYHVVNGKDGSMCIVAVYEKHYYRAGNRLTLTVVIDDMQGTTNVCLISGGGGEGLFRFNWGASRSFEDSVLKELNKYKY